MNGMSQIFKRFSFIKNPIKKKYFELNCALSSNYSGQIARKQRNRLLLLISSAGVGCSLYGAYVYIRGNREVVYSAQINKNKVDVKNLPVYDKGEVSRHCSKENGGSIWVTFKDGVYDITKFVDLHPGGDKIMMAAGGSLEPFWLLYSVHQTPEILSMLEEYRIGQLAAEDILKDQGEEGDPYRTDPRRHPVLRPASVKPYNAEPSPELLAESFITPQEIFYVRNHLPVPDVSIDDYELEVSGLKMKSKVFKMKDILKMPSVTIAATIQCAGNRRSEMTQVKPVKGLNWGPAAIGNAEWTGVKLRDVLLKMGFQEGCKGLHVQFEGLDTDPASMPYGASIPIEKAMDPNGDVILAYKMNGVPLNRDHGFPLRVIVPGVTGARNVKWLSKIIVSDKESDSHWQQRDYKGFSPSVDWDTVDFSKSPAIQELPVTSAVCSPSSGQSLSLSDKGTIPVKGYAWSGGGRKIIRVDVTCDQGKTWHTADLGYQDPALHPYHWSWTLWDINLPVHDKPENVEIWVKAVDSGYNTQPESFANIWNLRGVLSNAYHRVKVNLK